MWWARLLHYRRQAEVSLTAHRLRHSFANDLLNADVPVTSIQKLLGRLLDLQGRAGEARHVLRHFPNALDQIELADKLGSLVAVVMGGLFVFCVLVFRRGIVGEGIALFNRMIGEKTR